MACFVNLSNSISLTLQKVTPGTPRKLLAVMKTYDISQCARGNFDPLSIVMDLVFGSEWFVGINTYAQFFCNSIPRMFFIHVVLLVLTVFIAY